MILAKIKERRRSASNDALPQPSSPPFPKRPHRMRLIDVPIKRLIFFHRSPIVADRQHSGTAAPSAPDNETNGDHACCEEENEREGWGL